MSTSFEGAADLAQDTMPSSLAGDLLYCGDMYLAAVTSSEESLRQATPFARRLDASSTKQNGLLTILLLQSLWAIYWMIFSFLLPYNRWR